MKQKHELIMQILYIIKRYVKADSLLKSNFMKKNDKTAKKYWSDIERTMLYQRENILEQSTSIKPMYQNEIWNGLNNIDKAFQEK